MKVTFSKLFRMLITESGIVPQVLKPSLEVMKRARADFESIPLTSWPRLPCTVQTRSNAQETRLQRDFSTKTN